MKRILIQSGSMAPQTADLLRRALPNAVTVLALFLGLTGLVYAADGLTGQAIACVLLAAIVDALDGRVARVTGSSSKFGAELNSLADVVCFGAVPAFILYSWGLSTHGMLGWLACLSLAGATALRLARFNVMAEDPTRPSWTRHFFLGVPAPAGGFLAMLPIYATEAGAFGEAQGAALAIVTVPVVAGLMVSTWPTFSAKAIGRKAMRLLYLPSLVLVGVSGAGLVLHPWPALTVAALAYLCTLPAAKWRYELHRRRAA